MLAALGLTVARQIPAELLFGLISGAYTAHGGVVRNRLGQIVAHLVAGQQSGAIGAASLASLVPGANLLGQVLNTVQIGMLARDVKELSDSVSTVLTVASTGAALSGIGLIVSAAGYAALSRRLDRVEGKIDQIKKHLEIKDLSVLKAGIDDLKKIEMSASLSVDNRRAIAHEARGNLNKSVHLYRDLWVADKTIVGKEALEECYTLAFTGLSWAESELGMYAEAVRDFDHNFEQWQKTSRTFVRDAVLGSDPSRLLAQESSSLSTADFAAMCDFGHASQIGFGWVDKTRDASRSQRFSGISAIGNLVGKSGDKRLAEIALRWTHRNKVLESQRAHTKFLLDNNLTHSAFVRSTDEALKESGEKAVCVIPFPTSGLVEGQVTGVSATGVLPRG